MTMINNGSGHYIYVNGTYAGGLAGTDPETTFENIRRQFQKNGKKLSFGAKYEFSTHEGCDS